MSSILDFLALLRRAYLSGTADGTVTVPTGAIVLSWTAAALPAADATVTVAPRGAGQKPAETQTAYIPASRPFEDPWILGQWGSGTEFTFSNIRCYSIVIGYTAGY